MAAADLPQNSTVADLASAAHDRLIHNPQYQFEFSNAPAPFHPPAWLLRLIDFIRSLHIPFGILLWGSAAVAGAFIIYLAVREVIRSRRGRASDPQAKTAAEWRPTPAQARTLLADADALAARGDFDAAIRLLLFRSIEQMDEQHPRIIAVCNTSREIARMELLPEAARRPFATIAAAVERSLFAGREVDHRDFAQCRQAYEAVALTGRAPEAPIAPVTALQPA